MKSKETIVAELLKKEYISTEDAAKLLEKDIIYVNQQILPYNPPNWPSYPLPYYYSSYSSGTGDINSKAHFTSSN